MDGDNKVVGQPEPFTVLMAPKHVRAQMLPRSTEESLTEHRPFEVKLDVQDEENRLVLVANVLEAVESLLLDGVVGQDEDHQVGFSDILASDASILLSPERPDN